MDPMTMQALASAGSSAAQAMGQAMGGPNVSGATTRARYDNSGWTVATGRASAKASDNRSEAEGVGQADEWAWVKWVALALVGVAAVKAFARKG